MLTERNASLTSIGKLIGVQASRISDWTTGNRVIAPETAFDLGDELRKNGWRTSGSEFLWAAAYWPDVLNLVKYLTLDNDLGTDAAIALFSWLPQRLIWFEIQEITARLRDKFDIEVPKEIFESTDVREAQRIAWEFTESKEMQELQMSDPGAAEAGRYYLEFPFASTATDKDLDDFFGGDEFQARVARAWARCNGAELEASPSLKMQLLEPNPFAFLELHVVNAIISASRRLNEHIFPSYVIAKLWRLSSAWLYEIGDSGPSIYFPTMPRNFLTTLEAEVSQSIFNATNSEPDLPEH